MFNVNSSINTGWWEVPVCVWVCDVTIKTQMVLESVNKFFITFPTYERIGDITYNIIHTSISMYKNKLSIHSTQWWVVR